MWLSLRDSLVRLDEEEGPATRGPSTKIVLNHAWERNRVRTREGFKARHAWLKSGHAWFRVGACSTTRGFAFRMLRPRVVEGNLLGPRVVT